MARGGYQQPRKPAPVSGPGKMSRRTDGQPIRDLPNPDYGEQATFRSDQSAAPMAPAVGPQAPQAPAADLSRVVPFNAPTGRPDEPITAGAATGAGPGMSALGLSPEQDPGRDNIRQLIPMFELAANLPSSGFEFRQFVRRLRGSA